MQSKIKIIFLLLISGIMSAQHYLNLEITDLPKSHAEEDIYVSGNFNMWNPKDPKMKLTKNADDTYSIRVEYEHIPSDRLEYKFTRGSWQKSESTADGKLTGPRVTEIEKNNLVLCKIEGWRDDFPASTASKNVHELSDSFYMPQLNRNRKILIYLPENYDSSMERFPVIYMHDGQALFDEATSKGRIGPIEWNVDETIDQNKNKSIVVAIYHHQDLKKRIDEYYFHSNEKSPNAEGKAYLKFIVETLKPYVDQHYRTRSDKENTAIAGSSMGGLIALYAGLKYPDTFGKVGAFSPSIWLDYGNVEQTIAHLPKRKSVSTQHYYFYAGEFENREKKDKTTVHMVHDVQNVIKLLKQKANPDIDLSVNPRGRHGALYWREAFPDFYNWLFSQN